MLHDIGYSGAEDCRGPQFDRISGLVPAFDEASNRLAALCDVAVDGLARMHRGGGDFPQTMRGSGPGNGAGTRSEGDNLRYAIIVAQGLAWMPEAVQRTVLDGGSAIDLVLTCVDSAARSTDAGAIALAAWAAAEIAGEFAAELFDRLENILAPGAVVQTVPCAWALTAAVAARHLGSTAHVQQLSADRLLDAQTKSGLFPHVTPPDAAKWARGHLGCFADQVYPIQALARLSSATNDAEALAAAQACAARIVDLQGPAGQWWWHYDVRDGSVVEGYPVYSVHQHAMAPMALLDLHDAGGADYSAAIVLGLDWIYSRPETSEPMISAEDGMIWRKVGRNEPPKLVRLAAALSTSLKAGWHLPALDHAFPPGKIDRECRPYELGWMLYAWRSRGVVQRLGQRGLLGQVIKAPSDSHQVRGSTDRGNTR
ncbi:MAG: hypothetical protein ACOH2L_06130 [Devosia sp.]